MAEYKDSMYLGLSKASTLDAELKRQSAYISLGLLALLFPFVPKWVIVLGVLLGVIVIVYIPKDSLIFRALASERDKEAGVLIGPLKFSFAILMLAILVVTLDFPVYVLAATIGVVAFGEGAAALVNLLVSRNRALFWSVTLLILGTLFGFIFGGWAMVNMGMGTASLDLMFFLAVIGTVTGALLYTIVDEENIAIPLGAGMTMWLFSSFSYPRVPGAAEIVIAVTFPLIIGMASYKLAAADLSGALAGVLSGLLMILFGGIGWFVLLLVFFFMGTIFTKYKYAYKLAVGAAQPKEGSRGYRNVFGNCLVPLVLVVAYGAIGDFKAPLLGEVDRAAFIIGYLGAMATATADTLASEIGSTYRGQPRMITTLKRVSAGTDGAVSVLGEAAALFGAAAIALVAIPMGVAGPDAAATIILTMLGGFVGTNVDSVLGATLQRKRLLTNEGVNFFATLAGGALSMALYLFVH
ncbi:DUF92 domain-containing protein [Methanocella conradii]|nr:DUF92 domain-containing protein [Methanocella conradii]